MKIYLPVLLLLTSFATCAGDIRDEHYGARLRAGGEVAIWCVESGWKVGRAKSVPANSTDAITLSLAKNEAEAVQLVLTPSRQLQNLTITAGALTSESGAKISAAQIEILRVGYVPVTQATDPGGPTGWWPDPLEPVRGPMDLEAKVNQPFWIRVTVPADARAGKYSGTIAMTDGDWQAEVPLNVAVFDFALPDKLTCETAFGFNAQEAFRYHGAKSDAEQRQILELYWRTFSAHHISPYYPAPLDPIRVKWPEVRPPQSDWPGGLEVTNEAHTGIGSLAIFDDKRDDVEMVVYTPLIEIPPKGLGFHFACRTALPGQAFDVSLAHFDANTNFIPGRNYDVSAKGNGRWETFDRELTSFPENARFLQVKLHATAWTEKGERTGLAWFDDVQLTDLATGALLTRGGDFEPRPKRGLVAPPERLQPTLDFSAWDRELERVIAKYHFASFRLTLEGMGGGTYLELHPGNLLGFTESDAEYPILFGSYVRQLTDHLRAKGWLDMALVYWFDEPTPEHYAFVNAGFEKLKRLAPDLRRMLTEQVEPGLIGGPTIWCPLSNEYNHGRAEERRKAGDHFWWYICTGPKAPYATEFIDEAGTSLRAWLWQTWQRKIEGVLIWQTVYWTSPTAYPDRDQPQNPYEDTMSWNAGGRPGAKKPWGNGDGRFLYPPRAAANGRPNQFIAEAPLDSIRWEALRDGLEDYEYLATLRRLLKERGDKLATAKRAEFEKLLEVPPEISADVTHWTKSPAPIATQREAIARAIESMER